MEEFIDADAGIRMFQSGVATAEVRAEVECAERCERRTGSQWHSNRRVDYLDRAALCLTRRMKKSWRYASHQKYLHGWSVPCRVIVRSVEGVRLDAVSDFMETVNVQAFHEEAGGFRTIYTFRKSSSFTKRAPSRWTTPWTL